MGYRSSMYLKCAKEIEEELLVLLGQYELAGDFGFQKVCDDGNFVKFIADDLKWYDGYKWVKKVNDFVMQHKDKCGLLGIGEDGAESVRVGNTDLLDMWVVSKVEW